MRPPTLSPHSAIPHTRGSSEAPPSPSPSSQTPHPPSPPYRGRRGAGRGWTGRTALCLWGARSSSPRHLARGIVPVRLTIRHERGQKAPVVVAIKCSNSCFNFYLPQIQPEAFDPVTPDYSGSRGCAGRSGPASLSFASDGIFRHPLERNRIGSMGLQPWNGQERSRCCSNQVLFRSGEKC